MTGKFRTILSGLLAVWAAVFLTGCTGAVTIPRQADKIPLSRTVLQMAIAQDAPEPIEEMANEFIRRAEYFSGGELNIQLSRSNDIAETMELGKADFCIIENNRLTDFIPELQTIELPYMMKNGDYLISGLNSPQGRDRLDRIFSGHCSMQVEYAALWGYLDFVLDAALDLEDFLTTYTIGSGQEVYTQKVYQDLNLIYREIPLGSGAEAVLNQEADLADASLGEILQAMKQAEEAGENNRLSVLVSEHRMETAYLLSGISSKNLLSVKQQAAVEQAAVLAAGYCRSMIEKQRDEELLELQRVLERELDQANVEKYFSMVGEIYQYQEDQVLVRFDSQLAKVLRNNASRYGFPNQGEK